MEKLGFVVSDFNADVTDIMLKVAKEHAAFLGAEVIKEIHVPGVFDMPLAIKLMLKNKEIDGVVTLGAVIEGESDHDQIVAQNAARKITDLSIEYEKPVALGFTGPKISHTATIDRIDGYSKRAVESAIKMIRRLK